MSGNYWHKQESNFLFHELGKLKKQQLPRKDKTNVMNFILNKLARRGDVCISAADGSLQPTDTLDLNPPSSAAPLTKLVPAASAPIAIGAASSSFVPRSVTPNLLLQSPNIITPNLPGSVPASLAAGPTTPSSTKKQARSLPRSAGRSPGQQQQSCFHHQPIIQRQNHSHQNNYFTPRSLNFTVQDSNSVTARKPTVAPAPSTKIVPRVDVAVGNTPCTTPMATPQKTLSNNSGPRRRGPLQPSPMQLMPNYGNYGSLVVPSKNAWDLSTTLAEEHQKRQQQQQKQQQKQQQQSVQLKSDECRISTTVSPVLIPSALNITKDTPAERLEHSPDLTGASQASTKEDVFGSESPPSAAPFSALYFAGGTLSVLLARLAASDSKSFSDRDWDRLRRGLIDLYQSSCVEESPVDATNIHSTAEVDEDEEDDIYEKVSQPKSWRCLIPKMLQHRVRNCRKGTTIETFFNGEWEYIVDILSDSLRGESMEWIHFLAMWQAARVAQSSIAVAEKALEEVQCRAKQLSETRVKRNGSFPSSTFSSAAGNTVREAIMDPIATRVNRMRSTCKYSIDVLANSTSRYHDHEEDISVQPDVIDLPKHWLASNDMFRFAPVPFQV